MSNVAVVEQKRRLLWLLAIREGGLPRNRTLTESVPWMVRGTAYPTVIDFLPLAL
jgi:hypothetical protein